jgi:REP element-mobilizing transposase RayT
MITRRCRDRRFLMRPDEATSQAFLYCLALAAERSGVGIIAFVANSNHWHGIVIDRDGNLPDFLHYFHAMFAKHQNHLRGRWENFWASEQTSVVELVGDEDVLAKIAYTLCNPVKDHLVERAHHWPGASALPALRDDGVIRATRPWRFFRKEGGLPEAVTLTLARPPAFASHRQFQRQVEELVASKEAEAAAERAARGIRVMGRKAILRQHWDDRPSSPEPRRQLSPRVASRNKWARLEWIRRDKAWLAAYRAARLRWLDGDADVVFPAGTYFLRRFARVTCAECDPGG